MPIKTRLTHVLALTCAITCLAEGPLPTLHWNHATQRLLVENATYGRKVLDDAQRGRWPNQHTVFALTNTTIQGQRGLSCVAGRFERSAPKLPKE
jgi:hypothetical protein